MRPTLWMAAFLSAPAALFRRRARSGTARCPRCMFPDFVPAEAAQIRDEAAGAMLAALQRISVPTTLRETAIETVRYRRGAPANDALVCLHGFDSNLLEYRHLAPLLTTKNTEVHALDLLGWGLTEKPTDVRYDVASRREHLAAYIRTQVQQAVTLVGASLGGAVAVDLALEYPQLVRRLVLIDAQLLAHRAPLQLQWAAILGAEILRSTWLRYIAVLASYEDSSYRSRDVLRIGALHTRTPGWRPAAVDFIQSEGYAVSGRLQEIDVPTLVVWGDNDRVLPKEDKLTCVSRIAHAKLVTIANAGHSPHIEKSLDVAHSISHFLAATQTASDSQPLRSRVDI